MNLIANTGRSRATCEERIDNRMEDTITNKAATAAFKAAIGAQLAASTATVALMKQYNYIFLANR